MPDPADVNADSAATSGAINVFSPHGLTMMFHGMVSVTEGLLPARTLVDTGASPLLRLAGLCRPSRHSSKTVQELAQAG